LNFRRPITRLVSYYALFQGWLLLSQPPSCLCDETSFTTKHILGTLAVDLGCFPFEHGAYPPHSDCYAIRQGIRSLMGFGNLVRPLALSVLYPPGLTCNASPQTISGRTSYLRARLAFHPYPQVIQCFFNNNRFGPPREVNHASPCSWIDRSVSGLLQRTNSPYSDSLSLRLRFNTLTKPVTSNSQVHSSIGTRLGLLAHGPFTVCRHTVSCSISLPFRGSFHLSLTVLVRYRFPQNI
jgi:hypothetical protein